MADPTKEQLEDALLDLGGTLPEGDYTKDDLQERIDALRPDPDLGPPIESGQDEPQFEQRGQVQTGVQPGSLDDVPEGGL